MTEPEVFDLKAAAAFLGLSPEGLRRLALAGEVPRSGGFESHLRYHPRLVVAPSTLRCPEVG